MLSLDGIVRSWNAGAERAKGYKADEIVGRHFSVFYTEADRAAGLPEKALDAGLRQGRFEGEGWRVRQDGSRFWAHVVLQSVQDESGRMIGFAKITRDITEKKEREAREAELEQNFRLLVSGITDYAIYMLSPQGIVSNWNAGAERAKGYRAEEIVGQHFSQFYTPEDRQNGLPEKALSTALEKGKFEGEGWRVRKDGSRFWAHVVIDPIRNGEGELIGFAKITRDVTEKKTIQDQVSHLAHHDALTALLNRASFRDLVDKVLSKPRHCALLYLDLDRFKPVNDTLGHLVGDKVLQAVAERIAGQLRKSDVGGRLGGDEFAVLLVECADDEAAMAAAARLIREIEKPVPVDNFSVSVGVSVGIAFTGSEPTSTEMLLRNADLALYAAKKEQRGTYRCYETGMEDVLLKRKALENDLRLALLRNEFFLQYQPIFDASRDSIEGYEALIRWQSPSRGRVPPIDFIPFAEENGFILEIGEWVLRTACKEAARWSDDLSISINVSPTQFRSPHLAKKIASLLETTRLSPSRLELEITETAMMSDIAGAKVILDELRAMGIKIALDDFGTGFSSLSFLRSLPFTRIKIDKSFVQDLGKSDESLAIVRAVTGLCNSLGLATTAEGVETDEQMRILQLEGCHNLQGYLLGRPAEAPKQEDLDACGSTGDSPSKAA
jgi:diguanylate cyclase (GGDEF)-like protein/PAS domain S-box-containing protein